MIFKAMFRKIRRCLRRIDIWGKEKNIYDKFISFPKVSAKDDNGYVIIIHGAQYGGTSILGYDIAKALSNQGYFVDIIALGYGPLITQYANIANVQICTNKNEFESCIIELKKKGFQKVICNGALTGKWISVLKDNNYFIVSLIHELSGVIEYFEAGQSVKNIIRESDALIYPANFVKNSIEKRYGVNNNTHVFHQGLANATCSSISKSKAKENIANKLGFDKKCPLFINVATINERKGFDLFAEMAYKNRKATYLWVGDGIDTRFGKEVIRKLKKLPDNLFLTGYIEDINFLNDIYRAADLLILTSREEPFGTIVLEAFLRETPVVAFKGCGGYEDVVTEDITGALVLPFELDKMISVCQEILDNKILLNKMQIECKKVAENSSFHKYCDDILKCFEDLVD